MAWHIEYVDTLRPYSWWGPDFETEKLEAADLYEKRHFAKWKAQKNARHTLQEILEIAERNSETLGLTPPHQHIVFRIESEYDTKNPMIAGIVKIKDETRDKPPVYSLMVNAAFAPRFSQPAFKALMAHELGHLFCGDAEHEPNFNLLTVNEKAERRANRMAVRLYPVPEDHLALLTEAHSDKDNAPEVGFFEEIMLNRLYPAKASQVFDILRVSDELAEKGICRPVDEATLRKLPEPLLSRVRDRLHPRIKGAGESYYGPSY